MLPTIVEVSYDEAMAKFKRLYQKEKLPTNNPKDSRWFVSEFSSGCLVKVSAKTCRIKGTVTFEEWRGHGYGQQILLRLIDIAKQENYEKIEVYSKHPNWFFRNGFIERRVTNWGVSVMEKSL